ncbi:MAG: cytochrome c maturation protein CcmE [Deltaproteobacteria bacterium]|nr:MAG: cytochrome c maturation protein CcmE [Deltaproteobacteria bacterium]
MALSVGTKMVLGLALVGSVGYLALSDTGQGVLEYVYVEQVVDRPEDFADRTIKVHGTVVPGTIRQKRGSTGDYRFVIEHAGKRLSVHYTNLVPDTFQEGGEVILTGRLSADGTVFESDEMTAKCPSKYEEEQGVDLKETR